MGLNCTHGAYDGSYGGFSIWREAVAAAAGFPHLINMQGFGGELLWERLPDSADKRLVPLLNHSDCDGEISPSDCRLVADGLTAILPKMGGWMEAATRRFIAGCTLAASRNESLEFD